MGGGACDLAPPGRVAALLREAKLADVASKHSHTLEAGVQAIRSKDSAGGKVLEAVVNEAHAARVAAEFTQERVKASCFFIAANGKAGDAVVTAAVSRARKNQAGIDGGDVRPRLKDQVSQRAIVTESAFSRRRGQVIRTNMQKNCVRASRYRVNE